jgi:hypothetical protein
MTRAQFLFLMTQRAPEQVVSRRKIASGGGALRAGQPVTSGRIFSHTPPPTTSPGKPAAMPDPYEASSV